MTSASSSPQKPIVLAFSGGLDTSFCIPWLKETYKRPVVTVTVELRRHRRGRGARARRERARRSAPSTTGSSRRGRSSSTRCSGFSIMGNVKRGNMYPLCVGAERGLQAKYLAAAREGARLRHRRARLHGGRQRPGALRDRAQGRRARARAILAPVRDHAWQRPAQVKFLEERKLPVPTRGSAYSTNRGLWGVTIGGTETLDSKGSIPESAWVLSAGALERPAAAERASRSSSRAACRSRSTAASSILSR